MFQEEESEMSPMELFNCYYESWKIISDYVEWVMSGGESFYGSIEIAKAWADSLFKAQSKLF